MKLINRDTDYAVKALMHIARNHVGRISVSDLAQELDIPNPFLRKIFQMLNKEGILSSYKGKGGGFALSLSADQIYLTDLIKIFQGPIKLNDCIFRRTICPDLKTCVLRKKIVNLEDQMISELKSITLAGLLKEEEASHAQPFRRRN